MNHTVKDFFNKKHIVEALWALLIALVSFLVGQFFDIFRGPQPVFIAGENRPLDTLVVRVWTDTSLQKLALSTMFDSLRMAIHGLQVGRIPQQLSMSNQETDSAIREANPIELKRLQMPSIVGGYLQSSMDAFATSQCPPSSVVSGNIIQCRFTLLGNIDTSLLSPIFLSVYRRDEKGNLTSDVFEQEYKLRSGANLVVFAASFPPGSYQVEFGFYRLDELATKYPPFYQRSCVVTVTEK